jgi:recombination protein RecR
MIFLIFNEERIKFCKKCFNFSEGDLCKICNDKTRDDSLLCVVETVVDLYSIEQSGIFKGYYHVLHGAISPIEGILPDNIKIKELLIRLKTDKNIKEVIIATNPTSEGNATAAYIFQQISQNISFPIKISRIATGIPVGTELEYIDKITLSKAIENRKSI